MFVYIFPDGFEALGGLHFVSVTQLAHVELGNGFVVWEGNMSFRAFGAIVDHPPRDFPHLECIVIVSKTNNINLNDVS
jgi:hypothetical protein